jgi:putative transposase
MRAHEYLPKKQPKSKKAVRHHIGDDKILIIEGEPCKCLESDRYGYIMAPVSDLTATFPISNEEFEQLTRQHSFIVEQPRMSIEKSRAILRAPVSAMMDLPKQDRDYVKWQMTAIRMFIGMEDKGLTSRHGPKMEEALRTIQRKLNEKKTKGNRQRGGRAKAPAHTLVGPKQFLIWVDNFLKFGPIGLLPRYHECGRHEPRYVAEEYAILHEHALKHLKPEPLSAEMIHGEMATAVTALNVERAAATPPLPPLRVPGIGMLRKHIAGFDKFDVMAAHKGVEQTINYFRAARGGVPDLLRPMQRVEADEWLVHLATLAIDRELWEFLRPELQAKAKKTRVWMAGSICCTTRVIPALTISRRTGSENTRALIRMMLTDKTALAESVGAQTPWEYRGLPDVLVVDEGSSNLNDDTEFLCNDLGIHFKVPQAGKPTQRGKMERVLQTIDVRSIARFSGRTFSNIVKKGKYQALARACVTINELCALLVRFIVDEYHNTPHAGLGGDTPRQEWLRATKKCPPTLPPDRNKIRTTFGVDMKATLEPSGIRVFGNWYWTASVQRLFEARGSVEVDIRVDTEDLGAISLRQDKGWLTVVGPEVMDGVSLKVWEDAQNQLRREQAAFKEMVKPIVQGAIAYAMKADTETRKRLLVQYRPMTGADFERARALNWINIPAKDELDRAPDTQPDLFAGKVKVGTKPAVPRAIPPAMRAQRADSAKPASGRAQPNPTKTRNAKPKAKAKANSASPPAERAPARKPSRPWIIKDRKR